MSTRVNRHRAALFPMDDLSGTSRMPTKHARKRSSTRKPRLAKAMPLAKTLPLNEDAYQQIKADVLACRIAPGERVSEAQLSERYKLGKAPIRNALARLQQEGLVRSLPRLGYQISPVTIDHIREVFQLRLILEPMAARLAAGHLTPVHIRALKRAMTARYKPGDHESEATFLRANRLFHVTIAEASGSRRLATWVGQLLDEVQRILHMGLALQARGQRFQDEHRDVLRALLVGDGETAARLCHEQLTGGLEMVLEASLSGPLAATQAQASEEHSY